jgi:hypothetical protein
MVVKAEEKVVYLNNGSGHYRPDVKCLDYVKSLISSFGYGSEIMTYDSPSITEAQLTTGRITPRRSVPSGSLVAAASTLSPEMSYLAEKAALQREKDLAQYRASPHEPDLPEEDAEGVWVPGGEGDDY